jgi:hypothetical protein
MLRSGDNHGILGSQHLAEVVIGIGAFVGSGSGNGIVILDTLLCRLATGLVQVTESYSLCLPMTDKGVHRSFAAYPKANEAKRGAFTGRHTAGFAQG